MLLETGAEAFLAQQRVRYLLVRSDGAVVCDTGSVDAGARVVVE
jgi:hypothetical protein